MTGSFDPRQPTRWPTRWRWEAAAWSTLRYLSRSQIALLLRRSAARLPIDRSRFLALGLPPEIVEGALGRVRAVDDWPTAWVWAAQLLLADARRDADQGRPLAAERSRLWAALAYHVATWGAPADAKTRRSLRAAATTLFRRAMPVALPGVERVEVDWRTVRLPALLAKPPDASLPSPVVVLLNGSTTAKEETILWAGAFLGAGLAVLALDWPGTGETAPALPVAADCDDLVDGVRGLAAADPSLDVDRIALVGFSLGGALAVRTAALDRRVVAVVAVTPPYDPPRWLPFANDLLRDHLVDAAGGRAALDELGRAFALPSFARRLRTPLLVFGAGRDLVVPPAEALRLAAVAGDWATLCWYPDGGHGLYAELDDWTGVAARWLAAVVPEARRTTPSARTPPSTRVDGDAADANRASG